MCLKPSCCDFNQELVGVGIQEPLAAIFARLNKARSQMRVCYGRVANAYDVDVCLKSVCY